MTVGCGSVCPAHALWVKSALQRPNGRRSWPTIRERKGHAERLTQRKMLHLHPITQHQWKHQSYYEKIEKIEKINQSLTMPKKTKCWRLSAAKKLLTFDIKRRVDLLPNGKEKRPRQVYVMRPEYQRYKYDNFRNNLRKLRNDIAVERATAIVEAAAVARHRARFPPRSNRSWPRWPGHPAKHLLRMDIDEELHKIQTPAELRASRPEFR